MDDFVESWCSFLAGSGCASSTVRLRGTHVRRFLRDWGDIPVSEWSPRGIVMWCGAQSWERETRRSYRQSLCSFLGFVRPDLDWARELPRFREVRRIGRPVPESVLALAISRGGWLALVLRLGAECGLRRGEIARVSGGDVSAVGERAVLHVDGKGGDERLVPLSYSLAARISSYSSFVFPGSVDGHLSAHWVGVAASRALGGEWTLHSCRHRFATRWIAAGGDVVSLSRVMGHASLEQTARYVGALAVSDDVVGALGVGSC